MGHAAAGYDADSFRPGLDDVRNGSSQSGATSGGREWRQVDVREERNHGDIAAFENVFKWSGKRVTEFGVFGVRHIKAAVNQLGEHVFGHLPMNR